MRVALDDNARGALHFLVMAGGLLALLGLGLAVADRSLAGDATLEEAMRPWRMGYLLHRPDAFVWTTTARIERLALTLVGAILGGCTAGALTWAASRSFNNALRVGRWCGLALLLFLAWCGLLYPPQAAWPDEARQGWVIQQRPTLLPGFGMPFGTKGSVIPFHEVHALAVETTPAHAPCGMEGRIVLRTLAGDRTLAVKRPAGRSCSDALNAIEVMARNAIALVAERQIGDLGRPE